MKNLGIHLDKHPISVNVNGFIQIAGFSGNDPSSLCCFQVGECKHFADYGISEGSLLLARLNAAPQDNDLVVTKNEGGTGVRVKMYKAGQKAATGDKLHPIATEKDHILGVVLSPLSFYR